MNPNTAKLIKITSTTLITCALGLELWNVYLILNNAALPDDIKPFFWIGSVALVAHGIEGLIAGFKVRDRNLDSFYNGVNPRALASRFMSVKPPTALARNELSRDLNPIAYGIYTFFVGFVGLQELSER